MPSGAKRSDAKPNGARPNGATPNGASRRRRDAEASARCRRRPPGRARRRRSCWTSAAAARPRPPAPPSSLPRRFRIARPRCRRRSISDLRRAPANQVSASRRAEPPRASAQPRRRRRARRWIRYSACSADITGRCRRTCALPPARRAAALRAIVIQHEQPDRRRQVALTAIRVDRRDEIRQRHVAGRRDILQAAPERILKADTGLVPGDDDRAFDYWRFHQASPVDLVRIEMPAIFSRAVVSKSAPLWCGRGRPGSQRRVQRPPAFWLALRAFRRLTISPIRSSTRHINACTAARFRHHTQPHHAPLRLIQQYSSCQ